MQTLANPNVTLSVRRLVDLNQAYLNELTKIEITNHSEEPLDHFLYNLPSEFEQDIIELKI